MKKLLTIITLSALVGTSAINLKPVFTNNVVSHGFKSKQINNKEINIKNKNDINPFVPRQINKFDGINIKCNTFSTKGVIYLGTDKGLYKSTDDESLFNIISWTRNKKVNSISVVNGKIIYTHIDREIYKTSNITNYELPLFGYLQDTNSCFIKNKNNNYFFGTSQGLWISTDGITFNIAITMKDISVSSLATDKDGNVYAGSDNGLWIINPINLLLIFNNNGFYADKKNYTYGGIVYNFVQKIDIKNKMIETATLDNKNITLPATDLDITIGEHTLILTLKDEYKRYDELFDGKKMGKWHISYELKHQLIRVKSTITLMLMTQIYWLV